MNKEELTNLLISNVEEFNKAVKYKEDYERREQNEF